MIYGFFFSFYIFLRYCYLSLRFKLFFFLENFRIIYMKYCYVKYLRKKKLVENLIYVIIRESKNMFIYYFYVGMFNLRILEYCGKGIFCYS